MRHDAASADTGVDALRVVIVAHDSGDWLLRGVAAVLAQDPALELVVVDNASRDGSIERLPRDPRLRILRNPDNRGFGAACNQGAAGCGGDWLLFLNPDCELPRGALTALRDHAARDPRIGALGAQLLDADGAPQAASRRSTPRPAQALRLALGLRPSPASEPFVPQVAPAVEAVDAVSGALMLMPRALFERLGGFDTGYVLHCEDLDLCRRVLDSGHLVAIANDVRVPHHKGTSSRRRPVWVEWQKHRGMLRYFRKFDAATSPPWLRALVPAGIAMRFPLAAFRAWRAARRARRATFSASD